MHAVISRQAIRPLLGDCHTVYAFDLIASTARIVGAHLEAGGKNYAIHWVLLTVKDNAVCSDLINTPPIGVNQRNIWPIERRQVFVVETRALTKLPIIRFQRFCGVRVFYYLGSASTNLLHFLVIRQLHFFGQIHMSCGFIREVGFQALLIEGF